MLFLPLLAALLATVPADGLTSPVHRSWGVPEGLPQSSVHALAQGPDGWLLAGTQEGVARFDGYTWQPIPFSSFKTACRPVQSIAGGRDELWIGTLRCGLFRFAHDAATPVDGLDSPNIIALHPDADGALWVATDRSIFWRSPAGALERRLSGERVRALQVAAGGFWAAVDGHLRFVPHQGAPTDVPELEGKTINVLTLDGDVLWVGTAIDGLFEVRGLHARRVPGPASVSALLADRAGALWVGDRDGGLFRGDEHGLAPVRGFDGVPPLALLEDREGSIWVGTSAHGLHQLRPALIENVGTEEGLTSPVTWSIAEDARGTIWIGTDSGWLVHLEHRQPVTTELPESLKGASVFDLSVAPDGAIWLATRKGFAVMRGGAITPLGEAEGLPRAFGTIIARRDGSIWAGTSKGLLRSTGGRFERVAAVPEGLRVHALRETSDGALWVGTSGGLFELRGQSVRRYTEQDGLGGDRIVEISEDADHPGVVWVGGSDGISRVDHGEVHTARGAQGLSSELDFSMVDDRKGHLWVGTDHGILRLDKAELEALFAGRRARIEPIEFGVADGMRNPECNGYSVSTSLLARDGEVWFATMGGAVHFFPERLQPSIPVAPVTIVHASSNGEALLAGGRIEASAPNVEIRYVAPTFLDPGRVHYRYRLDGYDSDWVDVGARQHALYTHLPPGDYTFHVQAYLPGQWYSVEASLAFSRPARLIERRGFWPLMALLGLLLIGVGTFFHTRELEKRVDARTGELRAALERVAQSERSVRIAERMASIGTLAAGVAHEINNPLAFLCANVDFALQELRDVSTPFDASRVGEIVSALSEASEGAQRVKVIVRDLKTFSRAEAGPPTSVDVRAVFETALNLSRNTLTQRARLVTDLQPVPPVRGEEGRLAQVLVNLLVNAAQAVAPGAADRNEIHARCLTAEDGWILAEVRDTGSGIAPENLQRIFDPFFTTKPVGVGTGLGLSICHGLISAMGGTIQVESAVGKGTTFRIRLPRAEFEHQTPASIRTSVPDGAPAIMRPPARLGDAA
jgi:signal transduction histidine kinase/ligand-binding sensor domain-containing protein